MNKPIHLHQNANNQAAMENKVNRNLSPSLAKIQSQTTKAPPITSEASADEISRTPRPNEPKLATPSPASTQYRPAEPTGEDRKTLGATPPPAAQHITPPPGSTRITPWIIASITLTLALFSGNYAWDTQQKVDKLSQRLELLEAQIATPPATNLLKDNDSFAKTEQELLTLKQAQGQLNVTISTLQNELTADTEQASSRLTSLEDSLADLIRQTPETTLNKSGNKSLAAQNIESKSGTEAVVATASGETSSGPRSTGGADAPVTDSWLINIASFSDPRAANKSYAKVLDIVSKASIKPMNIKGKTVYRVRAESYSSLAEAEREALALQTQLGLSGLWISRD